MSLAAATPVATPRWSPRRWSVAMCNRWALPGAIQLRWAVSGWRALWSLFIPAPCRVAKGGNCGQAVLSVLVDKSQWQLGAVGASLLSGTL